MLKLEKDFTPDHRTGGLRLEYRVVINGEVLAIQGITGSRLDGYSAPPPSVVAMDMRRKLVRAIEDRLFGDEPR